MAARTRSLLEAPIVPTLLLLATPNIGPRSWRRPPGIHSDQKRRDL